MSDRAPLIPDVDELPAIDDVAPQPETVDLAEIDLDFAGDEPRHTDAATVRAAGGVTTEKRPRGIVDAGQSVGLSWALMRQPTEIALIATEASRVLDLRLPQLEEFARRSHALACNLNALYGAYLRGDNCLNVGARARGFAPPPRLHRRADATAQRALADGDAAAAARAP